MGSAQVHTQANTQAGVVLLLASVEECPTALHCAATTRNAAQYSRTQKLSTLENQKRRLLKRGFTLRFSLDHFSSHKHGNQLK